MTTRYFYNFIWVFALQLHLCSGISQSLTGYLKEAAENNPNLKASYLEFEAAMKRVTYQNAIPDPTLTFGYFISPIETRVGAQQAKISLSQRFPWFGTVKANQVMLTKQAESRYQKFLNHRNELFFQVKTAYYPIYELQEHIRLKKANVEILESYKQLASTSFSSGIGAMADVVRTDIMLDELSTDVQLSEAKLRSQQIVFNRLLNRPDSIQVLMDDLSVVVGLPNNYRKDNLNKQNPMLEQVKLHLISLKAQEQVARKNTLPHIGVGLDYAFIGRRTDSNVSDNGKNAFMPMVNLSLPVFRRKYTLTIEESQLQQQAVENKLKGLENELFAQYAKVSFTVEEALQNYRLYHDQVDRAKQILNLVYSDYSNTGKGLEEVLKTQQQILKYEINKASAVRKYFVSLAQLDLLTAKPEIN